MTTDNNTSNQSCAFTRQLRSRLCATMGSNCKNLSKFGLKWNNHTVVPPVNIIKQVSVVKMRRGVLLVTVFLLMKLRCSQSRCEETGSRSSNSDVGVFESTNPNDCHSVRRLQRNICLLFLRFQQTVGLDGLKRNILKRYSDLDYDSFVGLMGRRNAGEILSSWFCFHASVISCLGCV